MNTILRRKKICALWDYLFIIWYVCDASFAHSPISMIAQLLFVLYSFSQCLKIKKIRGSYLFLLYAIFAFVCWLNIVSGHAISVATAGTMLNVVMRNVVFLVFLFQYLYVTDLDKLKHLFFTSCVISSFIIFILNFQMTGSFQMRDVEGSFNGNLQAVNNAIAIGWIFCLRDDNLSVRDLFFCVFLLLFCALAGTRKSVIALFMNVSLFIMLNNPSKMIINSFKILAIIAIALFLLLKVDFIYDVIGNRFEGLLGFVNNNDHVDSSTETRGRFIELGFAYFLKEPLHGYGIDCFREIKGAFDTYSHNNYIELLFGVGLPGAVAFYLMYVTSLFKGIKRYLLNRNSYVVYGLSVILTCLFTDYGFVSYYERSTLFRILLCYFLVSVVLHNKNNMGTFRTC